MSSGLPDIALIHAGEPERLRYFDDLRRVRRVIHVSAGEFDGRTAARAMILDVDHLTPNVALGLRGALKDRTPGVFVVILPRDTRAQRVQAQALGATDILIDPRSVDPILACVDARLKIVDHDGPVLLAPQSESGTALEDLIQATENATVAGGAIAGLFDTFSSGGKPDLKALSACGARIVEDLGRVPLKRWCREIEKHHEGTFRHCLSVTGLMASFGRRLGLRRADCEEMALIGLLHDIGKARISLEILDKPGRLTEAEFAIMKMHTTRGYDYLKQTTDLAPHILAAVRGHHEYLDGSGYPDGLTAEAIPDRTRILTICDVYSALIEPRSYKLAMAPRKAYSILESMVEAGKLDRALVIAFKGVAEALE